MIRPFICLCMLLAGGSGLYLYQVKHRAQVLDTQIERTLQSTASAEERTKMLRAEWALLNDPERLQQLADRFLPLKPMAPGQYVPLQDLAARLPAPGTMQAQTVAEQNGMDDGDDAADEAASAGAAAKPHLVAATAQRSLATRPVAPIRIAAMLPVAHHAPAPQEPARAVRLAETGAAHEAPHAHHELQLANIAHPLPLAMARPAGSGVRVLNTMATRPAAAPHLLFTQNRAALRPVSAYAPIGVVYAPHPATRSAVGSALGMAGPVLAPPVPVMPGAISR